MSFIKKSLQIVISIFGIFFFLVWLNNSRTFIVNIYEKDGKSLAPKIYYKSGKNFYSEKNIIRFFQVQKNGYHFYPISTVKIDYLRFDPDTKPNKNIIVKKMKIIEVSWFKKKIFLQPLKSFKPLQQIKNFQDINNTLSFLTTGNDPNLESKYTPILIKQTTILQIPLFITAIMIFLILLFLYNLKKSSSINNTLYSKLILYSLFLAFMAFKAYYYKNTVHFSYPPDELAHLSYIKYVQHHHNFFPEYEKMSIVNHPNVGNYLSHPPLYYEIENLVYDETASFDQNILNYRNMSLVIYTLATLLLFYIGFQSSLSIVGDFIYLSFIASIPMFSYIGGSISNDNLSFIASAIFLIGFYRLLQNNTSNTTWFLIAMGGFLAFFSKLTAALLVFFALIYFIIYKLIKKESFGLNKQSIFILLIFLFPVILYQGYIIIHYHTIIPTFNITHPVEYLHSNFYVPENHRTYLSPKQWLDLMWFYIHEGWFNIHSHHSFGQHNFSEDIGLVLLHIFALISLISPCKQEKKSYCLLGKIILLSLLSVLIVQYLFSYKAHLHSGYVGGLQPRYLLPFLVGFAIMATIFIERYKHYFIATVFFIAVAIQALYSDFFYFLLYYR